jgi:ABC-type uncharacterized transport system substrate-binding protein
VVERVGAHMPPGEIPVELPTKYDLVINQRTANALGLTISRSRQRFRPE